MKNLKGLNKKNISIKEDLKMRTTIIMIMIYSPKRRHSIILLTIFQLEMQNSLIIRICQFCYS